MNRVELEDTRTLTPYPHASFIYIDDIDQLEYHLSQLSRAVVCGIDTETTGIDAYWDRLRLVQIATLDYPVLVIDWFSVRGKRARRSLRRALNRPGLLKVGHVLKFDWCFLHCNGITLREPFFDTQLAYKVLNAGLPGNSKLGTVVAHYLSYQLDKSMQRSDFSGQLTTTQLQYAADDASVLLPLHRILQMNLDRYAALQRIARLENQCIIDVAQMELNGICVDLKLWQLYSTTLYEQREDALRMLSTLRPVNAQLSFFPQLEQVNPNSPKALLAALQAIGVPITSTSEKSLVPVSHEYPIVRSILEYRKSNRVITAFDKSLPRYINPVTGRVHPNWFQYGARSGRITCKYPALTTIPHHQAARRCFVARPGYVLIKADYSQIELRIVAKLSGDRRLQQAYRQGDDIHRLTASFILGKAIADVSDEDRRLAKAINFGLIYGMGAPKLQISAEIDFDVKISLEEAQQFSKAFFRRYKGIKRWHQHLQRLVYVHQVREVSTRLGRRRLWAGKPRLTELINHPVQGLNADIIKCAIHKLRKPLRQHQAFLLATIYDEVLIECPQSAIATLQPIVHRILIEVAAPLLAPIPVEVSMSVGESWGG
jgi:DNA polymerase-1